MQVSGKYKKSLKRYILDFSLLDVKNLTKLLLLVSDQVILLPFSETSLETFHSGQFLTCWALSLFFRSQARKWHAQNKWLYFIFTSKRVKLIIFFLKVMINLWVGCRKVRININVFILKKIQILHSKTFLIIVSVQQK